MSQAKALLGVLEQGGWWSTRDLLHAVPCIVHSRISDLRAQGHLIEHRTVGVGAAGSQYRLVQRRPGTRTSYDSIADYLRGTAA